MFEEPAFSDCAGHCHEGMGMWEKWGREMREEEREKKSLGLLFIKKEFFKTPPAYFSDGR